MSVLAINPNRFKPLIAPIGLEYACGALHNAGIEFELFDVNTDRPQQLRQRLRRDPPELAAISIRNVDSSYCLRNRFFIESVRELVQRLRNDGVERVVLGGAGFSILPREILAYTGADFGVVGYGEQALPQLLDVLHGSGDLARVTNLAWRDGEQVVINPRSKAAYADGAARPRSIVDNAAYYRTSGMGNIETKRGCCMGCGYCAEPAIVGADVCPRPVPAVLEELRQLKRLGIEYVHFCDSEFNVGPPDALQALLDALVEQRLGIRYTAFMHPARALVTEDLVRRMSESGCREVTFAVDSGSDEMLERLDKRHTCADVVRASELVRKYGIRLVHSYLLGGPGESTQTLDQSVALIERCRPDLSLVFAGIRIYPGTLMARLAEQEGILQTDADLLVPVFYRANRVLKEFLPYLRRRTRGVANCILPTKGIDWVNLLSQQLYLEGFRGSFSDFLDEAKRLSIPRMTRLAYRTLHARLFGGLP